MMGMKEIYVKRYIKNPNEPSLVFVARMQSNKAEDFLKSRRGRGILEYVICDAANVKS